MKKYLIKILRFLYINWRQSANSFDIKGLMYIFTICLLLVLTSASMMKSLVQAQSIEDPAKSGGSESMPIASGSSNNAELNESSSIDNSNNMEDENKEGGRPGSIDFSVNTEQNSSRPRIDFIPDKVNKKTVNTATDNPEAIDVLVNKDYNLPEDYEPEGLLIPNVSFAPGSFNKEMRQEAANALEELFEAASADGVTLYAVSGYRSYVYQDALFQRNTNVQGSIEAANIYSARPGESEHQTGLAMDVTSQNVGYRLTVEFGEMPEGKWIRDNAHKHGFILRYLPDKEHITGYAYEPWHIRYLGVELATAVYESGLTYEEYLGM